MTRPLASERWCSNCEMLRHHDGSVCTTCYGSAVDASRSRWEQILADRAQARRDRLAALDAPPGVTP